MQEFEKKRWMLEQIQLIKAECYVGSSKVYAALKKRLKYQELAEKASEQSDTAISFRCLIGFFEILAELSAALIRRVMYELWMESPKTFRLPAFVHVKRFEEDEKFELQGKSCWELNYEEAACKLLPELLKVSDVSSYLRAPLLLYDVLQLRPIGKKYQWFPITAVRSALLASGVESKKAEGEELTGSEYTHDEVLSLLRSQNFLLSMLFEKFLDLDYEFKEILPWEAELLYNTTDLYKQAEAEMILRTPEIERQMAIAFCIRFGHSEFGMTEQDIEIMQEKLKKIIHIYQSEIQDMPEGGQLREAYEHLTRRLQYQLKCLVTSKSYLLRFFNS